ncbi:hypothetical protein ACVWWG_000327 [Bradyrhizobium sp. LB7.2]
MLCSSVDAAFWRAFFFEGNKVMGEISSRLRANMDLILERCAENFRVAAITRAASTSRNS